MDNLEKFKVTELDSSEMKQVQGGNWLDDTLKIVEGLPIVGPVVGEILP